MRLKTALNNEVPLDSGTSFAFGAPRAYRSRPITKSGWLALDLAIRAKRAVAGLAVLARRHNTRRHSSEDRRGTQMHRPNSDTVMFGGSGPRSSPMMP